MHIYFATSYDETQRSVKIPAAIYDLADFANHPTFLYWSPQASKRVQTDRGERKLLYIWPFGPQPRTSLEDQPWRSSDVFYATLRIKSQPATLSQILRFLDRFAVNILHCSSIDMGDPTKGEPVEILGRLPNELGDSISACVSHKGGTPAEYMRSLLETLKQGAPDQEEPASLLAKGIEKFPSALSGEFVARLLTTALHDPVDLVLLNLLASESVRLSKAQPQGKPPSLPIRQFDILAPAEVLRDLLVTCIATDTVTRKSIEYPLDLRSSLEISALPDADALKGLSGADPASSTATFTQTPDGDYRFRLPDSVAGDLQRRHIVTATYGLQSHLLQLSFKHAEEGIITLAAQFRDESGHLLKVLQPLGDMNVDLRFVEPLPTRLVPRRWLDQQNRPVVYQIVANLQPTKLELFDARTMEEIIQAEMRLVWGPHNLPDIAVHADYRDESVPRISLSLHGLEPADQEHANTDRVQSVVDLSPPLTARQAPRCRFGRYIAENSSPVYLEAELALRGPTPDVSLPILLMILRKVLTRVLSQSENFSVLHDRLLSAYSDAVFAWILSGRMLHIAERLTLYRQPQSPQEITEALGGPQSLRIDLHTVHCDVRPFLHNRGLLCIRSGGIADDATADFLPEGFLPTPGRPLSSPLIDDWLSTLDAIEATIGRLEREFRSEHLSDALAASCEQSAALIRKLFGAATPPGPPTPGVDAEEICWLALSRLDEIDEAVKGEISAREPFLKDKSLADSNVAETLKLWRRRQGLARSLRKQLTQLRSTTTGNRLPNHLQSISDAVRQLNDLGRQCKEGAWQELEDLPGAP